jgi:CDP-4-dehydro-6-deoxyglucose reductase
MKGKAVHVSLANSPRRFSVAPGQSVLAAALEARLNLPHSCHGGNCGACRARLLQGDIEYPHGMPLGLSAADVADGFVLLCQARALTDLSIETREISPADEALIKRLPCRIERAEPLAPDVLGVYLRLPAAEIFRFEPGQYVDIILSGGRRRSFSIASPPHACRPLELHIRRVAGGAFTDALFSADSRPALLTIEGPFGQFAYQDGTDAPMLLVGGGTGFAPLKSIIRHVLENDLGRPMTLYWGARTVVDLYAHRELEELAGRQRNFRYRPVLSEPDGAWPGRTGWVHEAVLRDAEPLSVPDIYASGPPAMIEALRRDFVQQGAEPRRLRIDVFDYARDPDVVKRTTASTKS